MLLEALFDDPYLLRIGKGVFAADDLFELLPQTGALIDVELHFNLDLRDLGRLDVPFE